MALKYPFGDAEVIYMTATGDQDVAPSNAYSVIEGATVAATGNRTINVTPHANAEIGWLLQVANRTDGTETLTFGTNILAPTLTGVAGKTVNQLFVYNGSSYAAIAAEIQID